MAKPDDVSLLFRLASALSREPRNAAEAVALLTRLLALEPQHALAHGALAWAYIQLGQRTDAKLHMSRLRRLGMTIDPALEQMVSSG
jgi:Flp pilus assembly protein TadD